jgi:ferredoxin-fold anticodon binding domain-containing protein
MSLKLDIHPVAFAGTDRAEHFRRAREIAEEIRKIHGIEDAKVYERFQKAVGIQNTVDPIIVAAIVSATSVVVAATITGIFTVLREKREKKDHRETVVQIFGNWYVINKESESQIKQEIKELIEEYSDKEKPNKAASDD